MGHGYVSHVRDPSPLLWALIIRRRLVRAAPSSSSRSVTWRSRRDFATVPGAELAEVTADGLLQLIALSAEPADLLAGECKVGANARRAGLSRRRRLRSRDPLLVDGRLDVFAHSVGVGEPR